MSSTPSNKKKDDGAYTSTNSNFEVVPLTPLDNTRTRSEPYSQQQQPRKVGWSSSMALFSQKNTTPQPILSESSSQHQRNPDSIFREPSVNRTAQLPAYQYQYRPSNDEEDDEEDEDENEPHRGYTNPWIVTSMLPRVESLTTPSSIASAATSASSSPFVFGQRRPDLRDQICRQDSSSVISVGSISTASSFHRQGRPSSIISSPGSNLLGESILLQGHPAIDEDVDEESIEVIHFQDNENVDVEAQTPDEQQSQFEQQLHQHHQVHYQHQQHNMHNYQHSDQQSSSNPHSANTVLSSLEGWTRAAGQSLSRATEMGQTQLRQLARHATCSTNRVVLHRPAHPLSPIMEPWNDLEELQKTHKTKMDQMMMGREHIEEEKDFYDFALVLTPQPVYSFWASHLDFRAEQLGLWDNCFIQSMPSADDDGTQHSSSSREHDLPIPIDARPFLTPQISRKIATSTPTPESEQKSFFWSAGLDTSTTTIVKPRLSLFEKALGVFSPTSSQLPTETPSSSSQNANAAPTSTATKRRRWGNRLMHETPDSMSPPIRSAEQGSVRKRNRIDTEETVPLDNSKRMKSAAVFPSQVVPRGIAARSNGMVPFLSALKRGIVVRRHRPGTEAYFVKITSQDGGDTIKYEPVTIEEAMMAFKEQRVRYNRKKNTASATPPSWSIEQDDDNGDDKAVPDFIAAEQYRRKQRAGLSQTVQDAATKLKNSGSIRTQDIIAVHPGRHQDPRVDNGEIGTQSLRKSKSEFEPLHSFSIIGRGNHRIQKSKTAIAASERWHSGEGSDAAFRTIDLEAATEGEYWLVFRGFLLLHRDAASGRFASHRAAGFGNNYNADNNDDKENSLQKDAYHEPRNIGFVERFVAKHIRKVDLTLDTNGAAEPGAVPPPSDYFLGFRSPGTQIWSRLRQAGLETTRIYGIDTRRVMIKLRCPTDRLNDVAEVLRIKLKTRQGKFMPFRESIISTFVPLTDETNDEFFRSAERQKVIDFIVRSRIRDSGAELGPTTELGKMILVRVPLHMHHRLDALYQVWGFSFWKRHNWINRSGYSLSVDQDDHTETTNGDSPVRQQKVPNFFARLITGAFHQPLDSIEEYFGEKVTFYFAWLQHCSYHLLYLSILGLVVTICMYSSDNWDHPIRPFYSLAVMLWSFWVLAKWRQRQNLLAHRWGTMDYKVQETTRPQFKGEYKRDALTGEWNVYYPSWKRYLKYLISFPITLGFTVGTLLLILMVHANRDQMLARYFDQKENPGSNNFEYKFSVHAIGKTKPIHSVDLSSENLSDPQFWFIIAGLPSLLGLCLPLLNFILMRISVALNNFENYRTESHYRTALIVKVFSFRFVCYFATLYYYCFLSVDPAATDRAAAIENGILRVGTGVFVYITVAHYWGLFIQINFPLLIYSIRRRKQKKRLHEELMQVEREEAELEDLTEEEASNEDIQEKKIHLINKRLLLDQAQDALWQETMLPQHDSFPEYINAVIQFAYVTCFSVVLPLTPMICLVNHLISMRLDAYKLCRTRKRPLAIKTGGIGVWDHVLHIVTVIAILTNCALMGFTNVIFTSIPKIEDLGLFVIVVGWEHVMLLIKYIIQTTTPKLPKSVRDEMAKDQYDLARQRATSMRAKKDRQSRANIFRSPTDAQMLRRNSSSLEKRPPHWSNDEKENNERPSDDSSVRQKSAKNLQHHGLVTIPSEDFSESNLTTEREALQPLDTNTATTKTDFASPICVPTPFHLGQSMDAEVRTPSSLRKRRTRFSNDANVLAMARQQASIRLSNQGQYGTLHEA